ncbi:MAG: hypothetical protein V3V15_08305 [Sphingorhabdus sp.]
MISTLPILLMVAAPANVAPIGSPVMASVQSAQKADTTKKDKTGDYHTKKICKKFPPPTGTRFGPRKVCRTKAQWDTEQSEKDKEMDRMQGRWSREDG